MAGTREALLLLVAVCLTGEGVGVRGEEGICVSMEFCTTNFKDQAKLIAHDRETYCRLLRKKLKCYRTARGDCPPDQERSAQSQIQSAQIEQRRACGAGWIQASHWLMALSAMLALLFHRHL